MTRPAQQSREQKLSAEPSAELIAQCQTGDSDALAQLVNLVMEDVHRILYRLVGGDVDHEDLCQEALLAICRSVERFRAESSFRTWMFSVCARIARRHMARRRRPLPAHLLNPAQAPHPTGDPESAASANQQLFHLQQALSDMKPKKRLVYLLCDIEGIDAEEVAIIVGSPVATVHTRLFHARQELRRAFSKRHPETKP